MIEPINFDKPVYNAVNIKIRKPEVNAGMSNPDSVNNDNGIYNAVKIDIDKPKVNTQPMPVYEYPDADDFVTYGMIGYQYDLPETFPMIGVYPNSIEAVPAEEVVEEEVVVPEPNYTTTEAEKGDLAEGLSFHSTENVKKKPEIIPSEPILPRVDVSRVKSNLNSSDYDVQALQMEEIVRAVLENKESAQDYLVSDVFTGLIGIAEKDVTRLAPPSREQIDARIKIINIITEAEKNPDMAKDLSNKISEEEIILANDLSPMELATRNKEYALTTIGVLAESFIDKIEEIESRTVPITDVPGASVLADALRRDPDPGIKLAAIDALSLISRPEYKNELSVLFELAKTDKNPAISKLASEALADLNKS